MTHTVSKSIAKDCWAVPIGQCYIERQKVLRNANRNTNEPKDEFSRTWSTIQLNSSGIIGPALIAVRLINTSSVQKHKTIDSSKFKQRYFFISKFVPYHVSHFMFFMFSSQSRHATRVGRAKQAKVIASGDMARNRRAD